MTWLALLIAALLLAEALFYTPPPPCAPIAEEQEHVAEGMILGRCQTP